MFKLNLLPLSTAQLFLPGQRVDLHPGTDRWMMGDPWGRVVSVTKDTVLVQLYRSGDTRRFHVRNLVRKPHWKLTRIGWRQILPSAFARHAS